MSLKFTTAPTKRLAASILSTDSSIQLSDVLGWDGEALAAGDFGTQAFGVLRNPANTLVEIFEWDPSTIATGTVTLTRRGLAFDATSITTEVAGNKRDWVKNETLVELGTDAPHVLQWLKDYMDALVIAGAPNASTTAKGISELATAAQIDDDDATGETGAPLVTSPDNLAASKYGLRLPSADQKAALAGAGGTPSATNKYVTEQGLTALGVDQGQTTANASTSFGEADATTKRNKVAQSFVVGDGVHYLRGVKLRREASVGTFTGTVTVSVQADSAGSPSGTPLLTKTFSNAAWHGVTAANVVSVLFSSELATTPGTTYWIVAEASTADSANCPTLATNSAAAYAAGVLKYRNATDGWVTVSGVDLYFQTLEGLGGRGLKDAAYNTGAVRDALPTGRTKCFDETAPVAVGSFYVLYHGLGKVPYEIELQTAQGASTYAAYARAVVDLVGLTYQYSAFGYNEATNGYLRNVGGAVVLGTTNVIEYSQGGVPAAPDRAYRVQEFDENVIVFSNVTGTDCTVTVRA